MAKSARSRAASLLGRKGRKILMEKLRRMTPEERSAHMRAVGAKRWQRDSEVKEKAS